jgi:hypothetical protein
MDIIIKRIDTPSVSNMRMINIHDSINRWVSVVGIRMSIVNLGSEDSFFLFIETSSHKFELIEVDLNGGVSIWRREFLFSESFGFFLRKLTNKSLSGLYHGNCIVIKLIKIIRCEKDILRVITHPLNIL